MKISIQNSTFDLTAETTELLNNNENIGAVAHFLGIVRSNSGKMKSALKGMFLEHYPAMTQSSLNGIVKQACEKWLIKDICIIHRIGYLTIGEPIVLVICLSEHREAALLGCQYIIHQLKVNAPFWKKEYYQDGSTLWVEQQQKDQILAKRPLQNTKNNSSETTLS